jgi:uncharacterized protein HemX
MNGLAYAAIGAPDSSDCLGSLDYSASIAVIIVSCVLGLAWAVVNFIQVRKINVEGSGDTSTGQLVENISEEQRKLLIELGDKIANVIDELT